MQLQLLPTPLISLDNHLTEVIKEYNMRLAENAQPPIQIQYSCHPLPTQPTEDGSGVVIYTFVFQTPEEEEGLVSGEAIRYSVNAFYRLIRTKVPNLLLQIFKPYNIKKAELRLKGSNDRVFAPRIYAAEGYYISIFNSDLMLSITINFMQL